MCGQYLNICESPVVRNSACLVVQFIKHKNELTRAKTSCSQLSLEAVTAARSQTAPENLDLWKPPQETYKMQGVAWYLKHFMVCFRTDMTMEISTLLYISLFVASASAWGRSTDW